MTITDYLLVVFTAISALAACAACLISVWGYRASQAPNVVVYLEVDKKTSCVYLCVGNFGSRTAHDISISLSEIPAVEDEFDREHLQSFVSAGISTLPPGLSRKTAAGAMDDRAYADFSKVYEASVEYARKRGGRWKICEK